jgi:hypothetical protein
MEIVSFSLSEPLPQTLEKSGRWVKRRAPTAFKAGDYPDKNFAITQDELRTAVEDFNRAGKPVNFDIEHLHHTVLKDKLGAVTKLEMNPDGTSFGLEAFIPEWLDREAGKEIPISVQFDRATKRLKGFAFTANPRIDDARLLASFAMDMASDGPMPDPPASMSGPAMHGPDLFKAVANLVKQSRADADKNPDIYSKSYVRTLEKLLDLCNDNGASKGERKADDSDDGGFNVTRPTDPTVVQMQATIAQLQAQLNAQRKQFVQGEAVSFCNLPAVKARITPEEVGNVMATYVALAEQDHVNFSANPAAPTTLLTGFKDTILKRRPHGLTEETVHAGGSEQTTLDPSFSTPPPNRPGPSARPLTKERIDDLLSKTETGRKVLAERNGAAR